LQNFPKKLTISIVLYNQDISVFENLLKSLNTSVKIAKDSGLIPEKLFIIDNSDKKSDLDKISMDLISKNWDFSFEFKNNSINIGFGKAHNLILNKIISDESSSADMHLVLNPDVIVNQDCIKNAFSFIENNPDVGMITPMSYKKNNLREYLCKRYPSIFDLFLRGFAPVWIKKLFENRLDRYEMKKETNEALSKEIPIASGCFMFLRNAAIKDTGTFDPCFFLYFEDFDYSIRIRKNWKICYLPYVRIIHYGGHTSKKGLKHILFFMLSGIKFYNKHGWKFL